MSLQADGAYARLNTDGSPRQWRRAFFLVFFLASLLGGGLFGYYIYREDKCAPQNSAGANVHPNAPLGSFEAGQNAVRAAAADSERLAAAARALRGNTLMTPLPPAPREPPLAPGSSLCTSAECVDVAATMRQAMNMSVDPCQDFYMFACGGWMEQNPRVQPHGTWGRLHQLSEFKDRKVSSHVVNKWNDKLDGVPIDGPIGEMVDFYATCVNFTAKDLEERKGASDVVALVDSLIRAAWPSPRASWSMQEFGRMQSAHDSLLDVLGASFTPLFMFQAVDKYQYTGDVRDALRKHMAPVFLPNVNYFRWSAGNGGYPREERQNHYINIVSRFWGPRPPRDVLDSVLAALDAEAVLSAVPNWFFDPGFGDPDAKLSLEELTSLTSVWKWKEFVNKVMPPEADHSGLYVGSGTREFFRRFIDVIASRLRPIQLRSLLRLGAVETFVDTVLPWAMSGNAAYSVNEQSTQCLKMFSRLTPSLANRFYVDELFDPSAKDAATQMVMAIQHAFEERLDWDHLAWMDAETREGARKKIVSMKFHVGYPEWIMDEDKFRRYHSGMDFHENLVKNVAAMQRFHQRTTLRRSNDDWADQFEYWLMPVDLVNAYYVPAINEATITAGILVDPLFHTRTPSFYNFGSVGWVIAHELTHGFDSEGRFYDENGNRHNWWTDAAARRYEEKTKCFISEFDQFCIHGKCENGTITLGENIADSGGFAVAHTAWRQTRGWENPIRLPSLEQYTEEQLFFVAAAQTWCSSFSRDALDFLLADEHTISRFRSTGTMRNNADFAAAFECKSTTYMNPKDKCQIW